MRAVHLRNLTLYACIAFAVLSGAYLGLRGCGSHSWYWDLQGALGVLLSTIWVAFTIHINRGRPKNERGLFITVGWCAGIYLGMHALFMTSMAVTGPFYPALPSSLNDWWQGFLFTWREGVPC